MIARTLQPMIVLCAVTLTGCVTNEVQRSTLNSRYEAATQITDNQMKDDSLELVAEDSARFNLGDVAHKAISDMMSDENRNRVASETALRLVRHGDWTNANAIARMIDDGALRDETLESLARRRDKSAMKMQVEGRW